MGIENVLEECTKVLESRNSSIGNLLNAFGELSVNTPEFLSESSSGKIESTDYMKECQFAIVYRYIDSQNKSDRQTFKDTNANAKAIDFIDGLQKYLKTVCRHVIDDLNAGSKSYNAGLYNEIKLIRSKSVHNLAQSLSTKINRYDNKALITSIFDALQRGVTIKEIGEVFSSNYSVVLSGKSGNGIPKYKEYLDRQKAINNLRRSDPGYYI